MDIRSTGIPPRSAKAIFRAPPDLQTRKFRPAGVDLRNNAEITQKFRRSQMLLAC